MLLNSEKTAKCTFWCLPLPRYIMVWVHKLLFCLTYWVVKLISTQRHLQIKGNIYKYLVQSNVKISKVALSVCYTAGSTSMTSSMKMLWFLRKGIGTTTFLTAIINRRTCGRRDGQKCCDGHPQHQVHPLDDGLLTSSSPIDVLLLRVLTGAYNSDFVSCQCFPIIYL